MLEDKQPSKTNKKEKQRKTIQKAGNAIKTKHPQGAKGKASNENVDDIKRDVKLQAVLLADSFSKTFRPITLECPKVLLPLVNIPMLDYTIEFLAQNGVEEVMTLI